MVKMAAGPSKQMPSAFSYLQITSTKSGHKMMSGRSMQWFIKASSTVDEFFLEKICVKLMVRYFVNAEKAGALLNADCEVNATAVTSAE